MCHECDAGREQFGARGLDEDELRCVGGRRESDAVVRAGALAVFQLCLGDSGLEGDIPQGRCLGLVRLAAREIAQESQLAHALGIGINGLVGLRPVDRQAHATPQFLEDDLVLDRELLAQFDEVLA